MNRLIQLIQWLLAPSTQLDAFLARASDNADLERRMRQLDVTRQPLIFPGR